MDLPTFMDFYSRKKGSRVIFYFYSTNVESFKTKSGYPIDSNLWHLTSWSNYLVWDKYNKDFVKREISTKVNTIETGPIWFTDTSLPLPNIPSRSIAVFDVMPIRNIEYQACQK